eukprot:Phypoly_transcript_18557.p1 GENE.Phypoly_transcript_18557~~Phypoly_transcript_18557.p1  ORF type:complete len:243 (+),score=47.01 Phypoly_transcript_18557:60-731(+)
MASKVLTLWAGPTNANGWKSLITAKYAGVEVKFGENFQMGVTNKTPEYMAKHPLGQAPLMDTPDGPLFESVTLARYVARVGSNKAIYDGNSVYVTSLVDQWLDMTRSVEPNIAGWLYPLLGYGEFNAAAIAESKSRTFRYVDAFNKHLTGKKFLVGDQVTIADICLFCAFVNPMKNLFSPQIRETYKAFTEWFLRCSNEPNFKAITGDIVLATTELTEPAKKN